MSTAATSRPSRSSWTSHSQDRPRQRPSTTPHGLPMRSPASVGQPVPPALSPNAARTPHTSQDPRTPSPNYFGFVVDSSNDPPDSNAGNHARMNWDFPSSSVRNTAIQTPRTIPVDANSEFELFRRQSDLQKFNLGHANLAHFTKNNSSTGGDLSDVQSPRSGRSSYDITSRDQENQMDLSNESTDGHRDPTPIPRYESPATFDNSYFPPPPSVQFAGVQDRNARLSLPHNGGATPPAQFRAPPRADTLPSSVGHDTPKMISVQECANLISQLPNEILLLDLRVYPQFSQSRIDGALNLCIPTTLLKRPSFNLQKLADTFADEHQKETFDSWKQRKYIIVYDVCSTLLKDAVSSTNVLKKFVGAGYNGTPCIIRGGFAEFSKKNPSLVDHENSASSIITKSPLSISAPGAGVAPVAGGCPMPATKTAANPFFGNIRQNMDLIGGVGQMPIKHPATMTSSIESHLPAWLRKAADTSNKGKSVSDKFLEIEKAEQSRMQKALSGHVSYGSPHPDAKSTIQIAGIEKGSKNRYNNIFPYEETRVKLQNVPSDQCDYVNASHVKSAYSNKHYIATQAPIPATFDDFWRLVWEQNVRVIVMLTAESEGGQVKSHPYWHTGDFGPLKLKAMSEKRVSLEKNQTPYPNTPLIKRPSLGQRRSTNPHTTAEKNSASELQSPTSETPFVYVRHFTLAHTSFPFQPMREITQLQYTNWPDFGAPAHPAHLLSIIEQTGKVIRGTMSPSSMISPNDPEPEGQRPVVVHCSAGCGRTGTFCTVDSVIDMLKRQRAERGGGDDEKMDIDSQDDWIERDDVDLIAKAVEDFRLQRLSMVQSLRQFVLCYESILEWLVEYQPVALKTTSKESARRSFQG